MVWRMTRLLTLLTLGLLLTFLLPLRPDFGQAVSGSIFGTVTDPAGGIVPGATVTIRDLDRGVDYHAQTITDGNYIQTHLLAGRYRVTISSPGFETFAADATVQVDAATRVDAKLAIGKASSTVNVVGATPLLKTDRAELSDTLSSRELAALPVLGRNMTDLMLVMPGAYADSFQVATAENPQQGMQIDTNGESFTANGFLLDGTENQNPLLAIAIINPNIDSLQELKVTTSSYDAEFGSVAGALIQATTKSGTNQLHGTGFEYLQNNIFNSANPFTQLNPPVRWNQFGGSLGGPIKKDKLFIFGDYQGSRQRNGASLITTVPTADARSGNLQALLGSYICSNGSVSSGACGSPLMVPTTEGGQIPAQAGMVFDPATGNPDGTGREAITANGQPNMISVPAPLTKIMGYLPPPNTGAPGQIFNNYIAAGSEVYNIDQPDVRVDYNISDKLSFFTRYSLADFTIQAPAAFGTVAGGPSLGGLNFAGQSLDRNQSLAMGLTWTVNPTLVGEFRFGTFRYRIRVEPFGAGTTPATDAGLPGLNLGTQDTSGMPAFYINGNGGFDFGYALGVNACNCPLKETENQFDWITNWTKQLGNHTIKWGAEVPRDQQQRVPSDEHRSGEISFTDSVTGNATVDALANGSATTGAALASFLLGQPSSFGRYFTGIGLYPGLRQTRIFLYGQDTWRITHRLTLDYGLRWENYLPEGAAKPGGAGSFDPLTGQVLVAGLGGNSLSLNVKPYNVGFAPRLGVAYQLQTRTVLRAGYGWGYTPAGYGSIFGQGLEYNPPILNGQTIPQANPYSPDFNLLTGPPLPVNPPIGSNGSYPLPDGISVYNWFWPLNAYRVPMAYFWNATVQHEFSDGVSFQIAYVGNVGRHLYANPNINQAVPGPGDFDSRRPFFPQFGLEQGIYYTCNCETSNYNGLQVQVQKHSHNLDFMLNYTYGKAMGSSNFGGGGFDNNYNWIGSYGPLSFNPIHALTFTNVWRIPYGRGQRWGSSNSKALDAILGGWSLDGITTLDSGRPFSPTVSNTASVNADFNGVRADIIGNPRAPNQSAAEWFNVAAFTDPQQPYRDGTAAANSLWGPALYVFNLALSKTWVIAEGKTLELRWENFNAFNIDNYGFPANTIDVSGAGQITGTQVPMRQMQFGLHFRF
ncbi:MAG TPA: TonB-dependent receptor [Terriglobia bacterium]|nr:TonB-dependent receptor [Terriglobia bacterium]